MEKGLVDSNLDETSGDDTVGNDTESLSDFHIALLVENQEKVRKETKKVKQTMEENKVLIHHLQNYVIDDVIPQVIALSANLTSPASPATSLTYEPMNITNDSFKMLENPPGREGSTKQFETVTDDAFGKSNNDLSQKASVNSEIPGFKRISPIHKSQNSSNNEAESPKNDIKLKDPGVFSKPKENYGCKGKVAENPKYRYKKESKPKTPVKKTLFHDGPLNLSAERGASEVLGSQSSKTDVTIISPGVKRKMSTDERGSTCISSSSGISADDLKKTKKIKVDDGEKVSKQCHTIATIQTKKGSEQSKLPSSIGQSKASSDTSSSEYSSHYSEIKCSERKESSLTDGKDVTSSEREEYCLTSRDDARCGEEESSLTSENDTKCIERGESSFSSGNEMKCSEIEDPSVTSGNDVKCSEREESFLTSRNYRTPIERQESSHSSASYCVPCSDKEPLTSGSDDGMFSEREEPSITSSSVELQQSQLRDSYMTNTCDLSELIESISYEKFVSSHYISRSQIDQGHNERVNLNLPSSSGITNVNAYSSNREDLSYNSGKNDVTCKENEQLSLRNRIDDETCCEKEPSLTSESDDLTCSDREDSTLTLRESFLSNASDLSEQISNALEDASSSTSEEL